MDNQQPEPVDRSPWVDGALAPTSQSEDAAPPVAVAASKPRYEHDALEKLVVGRTATLSQTIEELERSRLAALNMMEDAVESQRRLKKLNEELASAVANNERLAAAIEQSGDMVVITDPDGTIQYVNRTFEQVTGYSRAEAIGMNPRMLKSGKQDDRFYLGMWGDLKRGVAFQSRMVNKRKDGTFYIEDSTISPVKDAAGRVINYVGVKRDITERLQMEDHLMQTQKMESVGRLAGGVAHDFNNMLGVILGNAEQLLGKMRQDDPLRDEAQAIITAAQRSSAITRQLLAFARKQIIEPRVLDLNEAVEGCLRMLRRLIGENIELIWHPQSARCMVKMDPAQIDQLLTNLCVNARDAIGDVGKLTIKTGTQQCGRTDCMGHPGCTPGSYVVLTVEDTGCGMKPETLQHLFEPFYTTKKVGAGTGLGLATVHGIVTQNGGFIKVGSTVGQGTVFRIFLPAQNVTAAAAASAPENVEVPRGHGETILMAEDEETLLKLGVAMLRGLGYNVIAASTPAEALRVASAHAGKIDLLLSDVIMSGMNGKELAKNLLAEHPNVKVLYMSGYTADIIAQHGVLDEGVNFIQKPFTRLDLAKQVQRALGKGEDV